ncbi:MAG: transketolase [Clostridia bacterium]|nr:transketolase [Clostridia bacterium]
MDETTKKQLKITACRVRMGVIEGIHSAKAGHPGGSLSCTDILTYLYFRHMNIDPKNPNMENRDRFVLSKGHAAPALYATLANRGYFDVSLLKTLRQQGSILQGHPDRKHIPGVDMSTGSLGQGISAAAGMALSAKHFGGNYRVYAVLGDGEIEEGQVWEAAMFAANKGLSNLTVFVDHNHLQIDGTIEEVNSPDPVDRKFEAFGWHVITIDGNDFDRIEAALKEAETVDKPVAIVAETVKGKGVSYMENAVGWHGTAPNDEQYEQAMAELNAALSALTEEEK